MPYTIPEINYGIIADAIDFYKKRGFKHIQTPWCVPKDILNITAPQDRRLLFDIDQEVPVGSAEQGFLHLMINGSLPVGRYVSEGPCYRNEPVLDAVHYKYFHKVELIEVIQCGDDQAHPSKVTVEGTVVDILGHALSFMRRYNQNIDCITVGDDPMFDIVLPIESVDLLVPEVDTDLELGSYGYRCLERDGKRYQWVYGTGVAEPRFSKYVFSPSYHLVPIPKSEPKTPEKILEEAREYIDAYSQNNKLLELCELADILLVVRQLLSTRYSGINIDELIAMGDATERAFLSGKR